MGITPKSAYDYERFPVDEDIIVGKGWGDESETFLQNIDFLVRVGGGKQAHKETAEAKRQGIPVKECDL